MNKLWLIIILNLFCVNITFSADVITTSENAKQFVTHLTTDVLKIIEDKSLDEKSKFTKLSNMFIDNVDTTWIAKFVLGANYRSLNDLQKQEFANLYKDFLISVYVPKFREYNKEKIIIESVEQTQDDLFKVSTMIDRVEKQDVKVDYLIKHSKNQNKLMVFDIVAEGISMITTHRSEFSSLYSEKGYDGMSKYILEKINAANQAK